MVDKSCICIQELPLGTSNVKKPLKTIGFIRFSDLKRFAGDLPATRFKSENLPALPYTVVPHPKVQFLVPRPKAKTKTFRF